MYSAGVYHSACMYCDHSVCCAAVRCVLAMSLGGAGEYQLASRQCRIVGRCIHASGWLAELLVTHVSDVRCLLVDALQRDNR